MLRNKNNGLLCWCDEEDDDDAVAGVATVANASFHLKLRQGIVFES